MTQTIPKKYYVGRFSAGLTLIAAGVAYIVSLFEIISLYDVLKFWPAILILLGTELLVAAFVSRGEKICYDWLSLLLLFLMFFFSLGMAIFQLCYNYFN